MSKKPATIEPPQHVRPYVLISLNVSVGGFHYCRIELPDDRFVNERRGVLQEGIINELRRQGEKGDIKFDLTRWETVGRRID